MRCRQLAVGHFEGFDYPADLYRPEPGQADQGDCSKSDGDFFLECLGFSLGNLLRKSDPAARGGYSEPEQDRSDGD